MSEEIDPRSPLYIRNSNLIQALGAAATDLQRNQSMDVLAASLLEEPRLSNKQLDLLAAGLLNSGVLGYINEFLASETATEEVDAAYWRMESDSRLQGSAIAMLGRLSPVTITFGERIDLLVTQLNSAHRSVAFKIEAHDIEEKQYQASLYNLSDYEREVFERRLIIADVLIKERLVTKPDVEELDEVTREDFKYHPQYDRMIVFDFAVELASITTTLERFQLLQRLMYLGYGMGIRDGAESDRRYFGELGYPDE